MSECEWSWDGRSHPMYDAMIEPAVRETLPEPYRGMLLARLAQIGG